MKYKKLVLEFAIVFAISLATAALVTFLWNLLGHGESAVNWEISFTFAIAFSAILIRARLWKRKAE